MGVVSPRGKSIASVYTIFSPRAKMARVLFTLALLIVVFTTAGVFGAPTQESESPKPNRQKRTFGFGLLGDRDWEEFRRWPSIGMRPMHSVMDMEPMKSMKSMLSMVPMKSMISMFDEDDHSTEKLIKRLDVLERGQKQIIDSLNKILQDTRSANQCRPSSDETPAAEKQPEPVSTAVPQLDVRVQTDAAVPSTSQTPTTTSEVKDTVESSTAPVEVQDKVEPSTTVKISSAEVETSTTARITSAEVEDKGEPSTTAKITSAEVETSTTARVTSAEVEDKGEPSTTAKITSAEVEQPTTEFMLPVIPLASDKIASAEVEVVEDMVDSLTPVIDVAEVDKPLTRPQEATSSEESKEKVPTEEAKVDAEAPAVTSVAETAEESKQEATTQVDETNDVNNIMI